MNNLCYDESAYSNSSIQGKAFSDRLYTPDGRKAIVEYVGSAFHVEAWEVRWISRGVFNMIGQVSFRNRLRSPVIIRLPLPGDSAIIEEKLRNEAHIMLFLEQNTKIMIPSLLHAAPRAQDGPNSSCPCLIMTKCAHAYSNAGRVLSGQKDLTLVEEGTFKLAKDIQEPLLEEMYQHIAVTLAELWRFDFDKIGVGREISVAQAAHRTLHSRWIAIMALPYRANDVSTVRILLLTTDVGSRPGR